VFQLYYDDAIIVLEWCHSGVRVVLEWCYQTQTGGLLVIALLEEDGEGRQKGVPACVTVVLQWGHNCVRGV
jgi:hypothetical protein